MSQRGGSVTSDVRFGPEVHSPMIPDGDADFLVVLAPRRWRTTSTSCARRACSCRPTWCPSRASGTSAASTWRSWAPSPHTSPSPRSTGGRPSRAPSRSVSPGQRRGLPGRAGRRARPHLGKGTTCHPLIRRTASTRRAPPTTSRPSSCAASSSSGCSASCAGPRARAPLPHALQERQVSPADLRSLEDLGRFPFTLKTDLRDTYPFGLFASPMEEIVRLHASSGTTGKPPWWPTPRPTSTSGPR